MDLAILIMAGVTKRLCCRFVPNREEFDLPWKDKVLLTIDANYDLFYNHQ